jgi:hypothetical protein
MYKPQSSKSSSIFNRRHQNVNLRTDSFKGCICVIPMSIQVSRALVLQLRYANICGSSIAPAGYKKEPLCDGTMINCGILVNNVIMSNQNVRQPEYVHSDTNIINKYINKGFLYFSTKHFKKNHG